MKNHDFLMLATVGMGATLRKHVINQSMNNLDIHFIPPKKEVAVSSFVPELQMKIENLTVPELYQAPLTRAERRKLARKK